MPCTNPNVFQIFLSTPSARRATYLEIQKEKDKQFLSTPSARRATSELGRLSVLPTFLSTPSARRATPRLYRGTADTGNFYPRPPRGGRLQQSTQQTTQQ